MDSSGDAPTEFGTRMIAAITATPDIRRRVNHINAFLNEVRKMPPATAETELRDGRIAVELFRSFTGSTDLHHTVKEIIRYALDIFMAKGPGILRERLVEELRTLLAVKSPLRRKILEDVLLCSETTQKMLLCTDVSPELGDFARGNLDELVFCGIGKWETAEEEVRQLSETLQGLSLIDRLLTSFDALSRDEALTNDIAAKLILFHSTASDRHPELFPATSNLVKTLLQRALSIKPHFDLDHFRSSQPSYAAFISAHIATSSSIDSLDTSYDLLHESVQAALNSHAVCGTLAVVSLAELLTKAVSASPPENCDSLAWSNRNQENRSKLVGLWKMLVDEDCERYCTPQDRAVVLGKSVDILGLIVPMWKDLAEADQTELLHSILNGHSFSWKTPHGQKSLALLLRVVPKQTAGVPRPKQLLTALPLKFHAIPLAELLCLIGTPEDFAEILAGPMTEYRAFLMKHVLPVVGKQPGFILDVMRILGPSRSFGGYGPILFVLRSVKIPGLTAIRLEVFREYVRGKTELAVFADDLARVETFHFLCDMADPLTDFGQILDFVEKNMNHQFARFRDPFLQSIGRFLRRLEETCLSAGVTKVPDQTLMVGLMRNLLAFITSISNDLVPSSSYARRNTALQILLLLLNGPLNMITKSPQVWNPLQRTLAEQLFWESFPDNQAYIVEILTTHSDAAQSHIGGFSRILLSDLSDSALPLQEDIAATKAKGMLWTARNSPLYGQILRLRNMIGRMEDGATKSVSDGVIQVRRDISELVSEALVYHTGGLSMDKNAVLNDGGGDGCSGDGPQQSTTAQMLFVCCWRSIREVSILSGDICCGKLFGKITSEENKIETLEWMVSQLLITSHTGAFDGLAEQIQRICRSFSDTNSERGLTSVKRLLGDLLEDLRDWTSPLRPENTRKSAGLPRLLAILFVALKKTDEGERLLAESMPRFLTDGLNSEVAEVKVVDNGVRAVNILEAIFRQNSLNELTEAFIADGFILACTGMVSIHWPVRNAAASLFTGLMQRVFGPAVKQCPEEMEWREACLPAARFFTKYPRAFDHIKATLEAWSVGRVYHAESRQSAGIHSALLILQRLYYDVGDPVFVGRIFGPLKACLSHPEMRIRQAASKAFAVFAPESSLELLRKEAIDAARSGSDHKLHGILLTFLEMERSSGFITNNMSEESVGSLAAVLLGCMADTRTFSTLSVQSKTMMLRLLQKLIFAPTHTNPVKLSSQITIPTVDYGSQELHGSGQPQYIREYLRFLFALDVPPLPGGSADEDPSAGSVSTTANLRILDFVCDLLLRAGSLALTAAVLDVLCQAAAVGWADRMIGHSELMGFLSARREASETPTVLVQRMAAWAAVLRNSSKWNDVPEYFGLQRLWMAILEVFRSRNDKEFICRTVELSSSLLIRGLVKEESMVSDYLDLLKDLLTKGCSTDVRLSIARHLSPPLLAASHSPATFWILVIDLLRDDDQTVRNTVAERLFQLGLKDDLPDPSTPSHALSVAIRHLARSGMASGSLIHIILSVVVGKYIDADDRIGTRDEETDEPDAAVFEHGDRHEYHENMWLIDQLADCVEDLAAGGPSSADEDGPVASSSSLSEEQVKWLGEEIRSAGKQMSMLSSGFLADVFAYNRAAFRVYCLMRLLTALWTVGAVPVAAAAVTQALGREIEVTLGRALGAGEGRSYLLQRVRDLARTNLLAAVIAERGKHDHGKCGKRK
ncbi:putative Thyroid adenoma-associated protein-like protein [Hypsibius exemplaris]|uniref:Thyroid adenoma-associated protein-like protein n=1 Tax=Hypsibius exemplaris TaxID=2072580 RepID=A0A1W0WJJ5_HYPEX|nr:putative Thyroid adenoma-associated protein-like protein [Hypsibius exemplaris]